MKEEPASPLHNRYARIDGPMSLTNRNRREQFIKDELPPVITKARGRIFPYLRGGDSSGPWARGPPRPTRSAR